MKLLIYSGDEYHSDGDFCEVLLEALEGFDVALMARTWKISEDLLEKPDLVVIARWNVLEGKDWLNEEDAVLLRGYVERGGKLFAWHSGLARFPHTYCQLVGGRFFYHPPKTLVKYSNVGGVVFEFQDEHYFVEVSPDVNVFLWCESEFGSSPAGWWREYGLGKTMALTPAHSEGLRDDKFRGYLRRILKEFLTSQS